MARDAPSRLDSFVLAAHCPEPMRYFAPRAGRTNRIGDQPSATSRQFVVIQGADRRSGKLRPIKTEGLADFANGTRVYVTARVG